LVLPLGLFPADHVDPDSQARFPFLMVGEYADTVRSEISYRNWNSEGGPIADTLRLICSYPRLDHLPSLLRPRKMFDVIGGEFFEPLSPLVIFGSGARGRILLEMVRRLRFF
jgi:hypothetical protein